MLSKIDLKPEEIELICRPPKISQGKKAGEGKEEKGKGKDENLALFERSPGATLSPFDYIRNLVDLISGDYYLLSTTKQEEALFAAAKAAKEAKEKKTAEEKHIAHDLDVPGKDSKIKATPKSKQNKKPEAFLGFLDEHKDTEIQRMQECVNLKTYHILRRDLVAQMHRWQADDPAFMSGELTSLTHYSTSALKKFADYFFNKKNNKGKAAQEYIKDGIKEVKSQLAKTTDHKKSAALYKTLAYLLQAQKTIKHVADDLQAEIDNRAKAAKHSRAIISKDGNIVYVTDRIEQLFKIYEKNIDAQGVESAKKREIVSKWKQAYKHYTSGTTNNDIIHAENIEKLLSEYSKRGIVSPFGSNEQLNKVFTDNPSAIQKWLGIKPYDGNKKFSITPDTKARPHYLKTNDVPTSSKWHHGPGHRARYDLFNDHGNLFINVEVALHQLFRYRHAGGAPKSKMPEIITAIRGSHAALMKLKNRIDSAEEASKYITFLGVKIKIPSFFQSKTRRVFKSIRERLELLRSQIPLSLFTVGANLISHGDKKNGLNFYIAADKMFKAEKIADIEHLRKDVDHNEKTEKAKKNCDEIKKYLPTSNNKLTSREMSEDELSDAAYEKLTTLLKFSEKFIYDAKSLKRDSSTWQKIKAIIYDLDYIAHQSKKDWKAILKIYIDAAILKNDFTAIKDAYITENFKAVAPYTKQEILEKAIVEEKPHIIAMMMTDSKVISAIGLELKIDDIAPYLRRYNRTGDIIKLRLLLSAVSSYANRACRIDSKGRDENIQTPRATEVFFSKHNAIIKDLKLQNDETLKKSGIDPVHHQVYSLIINNLITAITNNQPSVVVELYQFSKNILGYNVTKDIGHEVFEYISKETALSTVLTGQAKKELNDTLNKTFLKFNESKDIDIEKEDIKKILVFLRARSELPKDNISSLKDRINKRLEQKAKVNNKDDAYERSECHYYRAKILENEGDHKKAIKDYKAAANNGHLESALRLSQLLSGNKQAVIPRHSDLEVFKKYITNNNLEDILKEIVRRRKANITTYPHDEKVANLIDGKISSENALYYSSSLQLMKACYYLKDHCDRNMATKIMRVAKVMKKDKKSILAKSVGRIQTAAIQYSESLNKEAKEVKETKQETKSSRSSSPRTYKRGPSLRRARTIMGKGGFLHAAKSQSSLYKWKVKVVKDKKTSNGEVKEKKDSDFLFRVNGQFHAISMRDVNKERARDYKFIETTKADIGTFELGRYIGFFTKNIGPLINKFLDEWKNILDKDPQLSGALAMGEASTIVAKDAQLIQRYGSDPDPMIVILMNTPAIFNYKKKLEKELKSHQRDEKAYKQSIVQTHGTGRKNRHQV